VWSSLVAGQAHKLKVPGSNPSPTNNLFLPKSIGKKIKLKVIVLSKIFFKTNYPIKIFYW
jgi:hypothetical protein